ncbi:MAG: PHP domain-containing protein [Actinomycetaceae bacterium]|nr:PHP domain-containing protein [Actinomycetaceae bacterium]
MAWLCDLHTHSTFSDGTSTPRELFTQARQGGLDLIGLTDHDTTAGWEQAREAARETGVGLMVGAEVSCAWRGVTVHMLSYLHDPLAPGLPALFETIHASRRARVADMVERIGRDYPLTLADVEAQAGEGVAIGRPHIADALIAAGCFSHRNEVFATILHPASPYYVRYCAPDPREVIETITECGGVAVMAHPRPLSRQRRVVPAHVIASWRDVGLFGIEVDHPDHTREWREALGVLTARYGLHRTGSSDFHGRGKTTTLGENLTDWEVVEAIAERGRMDLVLPAT